MTVTWAGEHGRYPEVAFRRMFEQLRRPLPTDPHIVTAYTNGDVTLRSNRRLDGYHEAADLSGFQGVRSGDFVVHGLDILRGSVGVSDSDGAISSVCIVCRLRGPDDSRYLAYAMRAQAFSGFPRAMARGVREGGADFRRWDTLGELPVPRPGARVQRAIANFLDTETARIDALLSKKRKMIDLLEEHMAAAAELILTGAKRSVPLRRLSNLLPGFTFPSSEFGPDESGTRLLRGVNVGVGEILWNDVVYLTDGGAEYRTYRLEEGDLVLGMDRPFIKRGTRVAAVGNTDAGSLLVQRVCRVRTDRGSRQAVLRWSLQSRRFMAHIEPDLTGVSVPHLSERQIGSFNVPLFSDPEEQRRATQLRELEDSIRNVVVRLQRQVLLLQEHRRALITAAVTGAVEVPEVAA